MGFNLIDPDAHEAWRNVPKLWTEYLSAISSPQYSFNSDFQKYLDTLLKRQSEIINPEEQVFYRAQRIFMDKRSEMQICPKDESKGSSGIRGFHATRMTPDARFTKAGRANAPGDEYLYVASLPETACGEVLLLLRDLLSVSRFKIIKQLKILNLKNIKIRDYTDYDIKAYRDFAERIEEAFSRPVDDPELYAPSYHIAEYYKRNGIDGIKYGSFNNMGKDSYSLVLWDKNVAECLDEYGEVYHCYEREIKYQNVSTYRNDIIYSKADVGQYNNKGIDDLHSHLEREKRKT